MYSGELTQLAEADELGKGRCKGVANLGWLRP